MTDRIRSFLDDLWFDLRERRLVPVLALLGVAAVAVPLVLGGSDPATAPAVSDPIEVAETEPAVAVADPGVIRDVGKRLAGQAPKNPFRQQLQSPPADRIPAGELGANQNAAAVAEQQDDAAQRSADELAAELAQAAADTSEPAVTAAAAPAEPKVVTKYKTRYKTRSKTKYKTRTVVKLERRTLWLRFGKLGRRNLIKGVESLDQLPRDADPVAVLLGVDRKSGKATFDLASRVTSVWGKGECTPSRSDCDYLSLSPGEGVKLRYQPKASADAVEEPAPIVYSLTILRVSTKRVG